jgi:hypothetical protein
MIYWSDIKKKINNSIEISTQLLLILLGAYIFILSESYAIWKIVIILLGSLSWLFFRNKTKHPVIWIVVLGLLVLDLYDSYFWVANHHFMLIFVVLAVILFKYHKQSEVLLKNIQILLIIVVATSALQKLFSSQFMSGDFYYYMINRGSFFSVFIQSVPELSEIANSNKESLVNLQSTDPNTGETIVLKNMFPNLGLICLIYAWITVALEFIVAIAILWKPKSKWTHLFLILMILGILFTRLETGFMALLGICGVFLCQHLKLRVLYVFIVTMCIILIVLKMGYH